MSKQNTQNFQLLSSDENTQFKTPEVQYPEPKQPKSKVKKIVFLIVISIILAYLITMSIISYVQIHSHNKQLWDKFKKLRKENEDLSNKLKEFQYLNQSLLAQLKQRDFQLQLIFSQLNESLLEIEEEQQEQKEKIDNLVENNPFFIQEKSHLNLQFVTSRYIRSISYENQNAVLDLPLESNRNYSLQFKVFFEGQSSNMQLGITIDNQNWTSFTSRFSRYSSGFALSLNNGQTVNNDATFTYASSGVNATGDLISMNIDTTKGTIGFSINEIDQGVAFDKLDFENNQYYPAVCLSQPKDEIKFVKIEVSKD